jgi:hypothetical protein
VLFVLASCVGNRGKATTEPVVEEEETDFFVFDMEASIAKGARALTLNELIDTATYIPLETRQDALLPERCELAKVGGDFFLGGGPVGRLSPVYRFDPFGRFVGQMTQNGRGPGEAVMPYRWYANASTGKINIIDMTQKMVVVDIASGKRTDVSVDFKEGVDRIPLNDSTFVACSAMRPENPATYLYFSDSGGRPIHSVTHTGELANWQPRATRENETKQPREYHVLCHDYTGDALFINIYNDTISRIRSHREITPHAVFKRGALSPLPEDADNVQASPRQAHFTYIEESGGHVFLSYVYAGETWCDVWSKGGGELLLHAARRGRGYGGHLMLPFALPDGDVVEVRVAYADRDNIYCVMEALDACKFLPNVKEDDNPVVMVAQLKKQGA